MAPINMLVLSASKEAHHHSIQTEHFHHLIDPYQSLLNPRVTFSGCGPQG